MKKSLSLAFLFATLSFLSCLIALAIYAVSIEVERFDRHADRIESIKNYVVTMGLLTQSNIDASEKKDRKNIIQSTQRSFEEYIYAIDNSELDYYEAVAYKTMHETRNYFMSLFNNKNSVFITALTPVKNICLIAKSMASKSMRASSAKTGVKRNLSVLSTHGRINCWIAQWCPPSTTTAI
ncbi:TPA: hypothetical protein ACGVAQ_004754 [Vibrio vulnificus]